MTSPSRRAIFCFVIFAALALAGTAGAQTRPPALDQLAKTYGIESFGNVDAIRYTFNLEIPALKLKLSHKYEWEPKTGKVTFETTDKDGKPVKVTYLRSQLATQPDNVKNEVEPAFVNDNYWLVYPFHAYWDTGATVTDKGMKKLPVGSGTADLLSVKYPSDGGYTPGDTWDLYVGKDGRVEAMVYHRGGPKKPSLVTATWAGYKQAGPLLFSTEHSGTADGTPLKLTLSDISVKMTGSSAWVDAK